MRKKLVQFLACPECSSDLALTIFTEAPDKHVEDGLLCCTQCVNWYVIRAGVPRMLPDTLLPENNSFYEAYTDELEKALGERMAIKSQPENRRTALQEHTIKNFGSEWEKWNEFGWQAGRADPQAQAIFDYKVLFTPSELKNKVCLDAGCGNGRYTVVARTYGAEVIGVDLSSADTAFKNTRHDESIHIIQGDLFALPLKKDFLDFAFSNGVLMHTGDAKKAFLSIVSHLNKHGKITVHLYHKGNIIYEFNDWWLRFLGVHVIPLSLMYKISDWAAWAAQKVPKKLLLHGVNSLFRLEPHAHYVFDWYTAPVATHHTYPEVYRWLSEAGLHLVEDHNATHHPLLRKFVPFWFLTVKAQKEQPKEPPKHTTV